MRKKGIKALCLVLSIATVVPVLAGCKAKNDSTSNSSNGPVPIHIMNRVNAQVSFDTHAWLQAVDKAANVTITYDAPPINNYVDRLQIVMASGDIPDIVYNWGGGDANYQKWSSDGLLADITTKVKKYSNLQKNIPAEMWDTVKSTDGKIYSVPKTNGVNHWGYIINQMWLDKLGLKAPTTLDEFENVCKAFTTQDPDGDGKNDTYGFSMVGTSAAFLQSAFNLSGDGGKDVDGKYKIQEKFEGYFPYLTYLRKLYADKVLDPEFFTNKTYGDTDKLNQAKVGIAYGHEGNVVGNISTMPNYDKVYHYYAPIKNDKGQSTFYIGVPIWGTWMISKNCKNLDGVLKFLDWGNSQDGFLLMNIGVKGVDYNSYDPSTRLIDRTDAQNAKFATESSSYMSIAYAMNGQTAMISNGTTAERVKEYNDQLNAAMKSAKEVKLQAVTAVTCPKLSNFSTSNPDDVKTRDTNVTKYITGDITLEQLKNYFNNTYYSKVADAEKEYVNYMNSLK